MPKLILFVLFIFCVVNAQPNSGNTISGFVFDEESSEAIIGVNVYLEDERIGASTNNSGYYVILDVPQGEIVLIASFLGYKTEKRSIHIPPGQNQIKVNIFLKQEILETETIVVSADSIPIADQLFNKEISHIKMSPIQINSIPQIAEADLLRSLQTLPGILPLSDFSSALYIRGGTPDQNLYLLDGTDVYNPEHAFGLFSTFNTDAIKQVDLSKGGFAADRGGRLSSIIDVTNLDGNREHFEGNASISLLSAKTTLQMPLGDIGSLSGSFRRTYFDQTIAKAMDEVPDYYFYDGNIKAFFDLDEDNNLTISGYGGRDVLDVVFNKNSGSDLGFEYDWGNKTGSIKWTHIFSPRFFSDFWLTASRFSSYLNFEGFESKEENILTDITLKGNLEYHYSNALGLKFGFEQKNFDVSYNSFSPNNQVKVNIKPKHYAMFLQSDWKPSSDWDINGGLRANFFDSDTTFIDIAPKLSLKYRIGTKSSLKFSGGIYNQYLHRIPRFLITDIWTTSNKGLTGSKSNHYILGYQRELPGEISLEIEGFYKTYSNIYSYDQNFLTRLTPSSFDDKDRPIYTSGNALLNKGDGHSQGIEILLRKEKGIITGWLGYSLANTKYKIQSINGGKEFDPRHDRTHTVNMVATIDIDNTIRSLYKKPVKIDSSRWSLGLNFVYSSGQPITEPGSAYFISAAPNDPSREVALAPTQINQVRLPYYARLDVSLTWKLQYHGWSMAPFLQIFNIGDRGNVWFATYGFNDGSLKPELQEQYMFPLLPTIGINFEF
jgi:CarboxypepD_reg-like domain/TonB dependent receptor-like, beta-barrel/TonB-dependent Receptor Plug Domain